MIKKIKQKTHFINSFTSKQVVFCLPGGSNTVKLDEDIIVIEPSNDFVKTISDEHGNSRAVLINEEFHEYYLANVFNNSSSSSGLSINQFKRINLGNGSSWVTDANGNIKASTWGPSILNNNNSPVDNLGIPRSLFKDLHFIDLYLVDSRFQKIISGIVRKDKINVDLNIKRLKKEVKRIVKINFDDYLYDKKYIDYVNVGSNVQIVRLEKVGIVLKEKIIAELVDHLINLIIKGLNSSNNYDRELYKSLNPGEIQLSDLKGLFVKDHFNDLKEFCNLNFLTKKKAIKIFKEWGNIEDQGLDYIINYISFGNMGPLIGGFSDKNYEILVKGYLSVLCRGIINSNGKYSNNLQNFGDLRELDGIIRKFNTKEIRMYRNFLLDVISQILKFNINERDFYSLTNLKKESDRYLKYIRRPFSNKILPISY